MKTLSFHDLKVGRSPGATLLHLDSSTADLSPTSGLYLIVAPNGFGKTTLLQTLAGVLPALGGEVKLDRQKLKPEEQVLYVSEYLTFPKFIYPAEWIEFVSERSLSEAPGIQRWIDGFRLQPRMKSYLGRMSQGERRKVTWLGAQASQKPVLLLDEPLDGLDLLAIRSAREMVEGWKQEQRLIFIVAHQVGELLDLSTEVFLIKDHKLLSWKKLKDTRPQDLPPEQFRKEVLEFYSS